MSFFARDELEPVEERKPYSLPPITYGPWPGEVGRPLAASFVAGRSRSAAVVVQSIRAYSTGCLLEIDWIVRRTTEDARAWREANDVAFGHHRPRNGEDALLLGVALSDGRSARLHERFELREERTDPLLVSSGGSSGSGGTERLHGELSVWLTPLPPGPSMTFVCAWPRFGLEESSHVVDTDALLAAASHAAWAWPEDADLPLDED